MKTIAKTSYIFLGAVFMLSSCSQEESPDDIHDGGDRRIVFHTSLPGLTATKATEIVTNLDKIWLTVFDVTNDDLIYFNDEMTSVRSGIFMSEECIWPEADNKVSDILHFFAYNPVLSPDTELEYATSVDDSDNTTISYKVNNFQVANEIADQVDFVTAYASGSMADNLFSGIDLTFRHQMSRVEVKVKGEHKSCDIEIAGLSIGNATMQGSFEFQKSSNADGDWSATSKGNATYIFRKGDAIVKVGAPPVSIMGSKINDNNENCATLIPSEATAWDYTNDIHNSKEGLYLNVLLRILDKTPTGNNKQQYPYYDNSQGLNALKVPVVLLPVDGDGKISGEPVEVYKDEEGTYYTDSTKENVYNIPEGSIVKEFGWAAIPVSGDWEPGKIYTYTLDYTYGVGVHGPETPGDVAPCAGDPIISDQVGVSMSVKTWNNGGNSPVTVPGS